GGGGGGGWFGGEGGGGRGEREVVGDAAAGEGVEALAGKLRYQAQRPLESPRSGLVGGYLAGPSGVTGRGQGYGRRTLAGPVGVQPEAGLPAGDVHAVNAPARRERGDAGHQGRGRDGLGAEDHRMAGAAGGGAGAQIPARREEGVPCFEHGGGDDGEHR